MLMIIQKICSNDIFRPLKLTLLSYRSKNQWSVVAIVTGLPLYFNFHQLDNLTKIEKTLFCVNQFSIREVTMIHRQ